MELPGWSPRERAERERFARAVEGADEPGDEEFERQLEIVAALRLAGAATRPDEDAKDRIREDIDERLAAAKPRFGLARTLVAAAALLVALGGLALVLSKDALPGDALYDVKRAGESASLGLTFGEQAKGFRHLDFARNRLDELGRLGGTGADENAYLTALDGFEQDTKAGMAQLNLVAVRNGGQQFGDLRGWVQHQAEALSSARPTIPPGAFDGFLRSDALLNRAEARVTALTGRLGCYGITSGSSDDLGPLPATGACEPQDGPVAAPETSAPPPAPTREPAVPPVQQVGVPATSSVHPEQVAPTLPTPTVRPTAPVPTPPSFAPPIVAATGPRLPDSPPPPPPLLSIPPLVPGLPGLGIG